MNHLICLLVALSYAQTHYENVITSAKELTPPSNNLGALLDPNFNRAVAYDSGSVFSRAMADAKTAECKQYYLTQYGLNFTNAYYVPITGQWILPNANMTPTTHGDDYLYRAIYNQNDKKVARSKEQFIVESGFLTLMNGNGNFTSGVMNGTSYRHGDILCCAQYAYLWEKQRGKPHDKKDILYVQTFCDQPAIQYANSQGYLEQYIKLRVVDDAGRAGYGSVSTTVTRLPGATLPTQQVRQVLTWNCTA